MKSLVFLSVLVLFFAYTSANPVHKNTTTCQDHQRASSSPAGHHGGMNFKVECDETTKLYLPMQCTGPDMQPKWCACFSPHEQMSQMSSKIRSCDCRLPYETLKKAGTTGCALPTCETNGTYALVQTPCPPAKKHCVHPRTGEHTADWTEGVPCPNPQV